MYFQAGNLVYCRFDDVNTMFFFFGKAVIVLSNLIQMHIRHTKLLKERRYSDDIHCNHDSDILRVLNFNIFHLMFVLKH